MELLVIGLFASITLAYLSASLPTGVIVGKVFFQKDIRTLGSGGTGMTNVFRNFGRNAAVIVFIFDFLKSTLPIWIAAQLAYTWLPLADVSDTLRQVIIMVAGLGTTLGHCYPIFAQFKGGKAVSSAGSFIFMTNLPIALIGLGVIIVIIKVKKIVSSSSITGFLVSLLLTMVLWIPQFSTWGMWNQTRSGWLYTLTGFILWLIILYRHKENIARLIQGKELDFKKK
jgi:glycerol-3-phosphate acyltransferase PlsY